ncbi:MAG: hypothetical protein J6W35_07850 [Eubacterium sp.]|nr:hypothetical protein [Eubacterium sp.]
MAMLIVSILFWCMPDKDKLGIAAIILSTIGTISDMTLFGWWSIIDVIILIINIYIYNTITKKDSKN